MKHSTSKLAHPLALSILNRLGIVEPSQEKINLIESAICQVEVEQQLLFDFRLNNHEVECLFWAAKGKTIQETADIMGVDSTTIETYRRGIRRRLKCASIAQAVFEGLRFGLINPIQFK